MTVVVRNENLEGCSNLDNSCQNHQDSRKGYKNVELHDHGCFFVEYATVMRPIFYIKSSLWTNLLDHYGKEKHKVFDFMEEENKKESNEESYILNIQQMGMPVLPVPASIVQQMIYEGESVKNIDVEKFVQKHNQKHPNITKEYMEQALKYINLELKRITKELKNHEILQKIKESNLDDVSDVSSTDSG